MTRAEMARRITGKDKARTREINTMLERYGIERVEGNRYRVRIDGMDPNTRRKIEPAK